MLRGYLVIESELDGENALAGRAKRVRVGSWSPRTLMDPRFRMMRGKHQ